MVKFYQVVSTYTQAYSINIELIEFECRYDIKHAN